MWLSRLHASPVATHPTMFHGGFDKTLHLSSDFLKSDRHESDVNLKALPHSHAAQEALHLDAGLALDK